jgi:adhesin/invasin
MIRRFKKAIVAIQIALQLFPPIYFIPSFTLQAQNKTITNIKPVSEEHNDDSQSVAQTAVQAGTALESGDVRSSLLSTATGAASSSVQQWLNQFGTAKVSIATDEHFSLQNSELDLLLPLYDQKENLLFTQLGGRRTDDRTIINSGIGYRHLFDDWMWGANVFYDQQVSGNRHQRIGFGAELGWDYLKLSANNYLRLSGWKGSSTINDYDERVANGFDIRATGYLPAMPQLGANIMYEQYFGNNVGLFGNDKDDLQNNPYAVTFGLNYTPVPLVTFGVNQKFGKSDKNDTQLNLTLNWAPGVSIEKQLDPSEVGLRRSLKGSRLDLVDRNNDIVLEYRKQELITLALPPLAEGNELSQQSLTAKVKSKYSLDRIEWQASSFLSAGGKITTGNSPEQFILTLPAWKASGANSYTLQATAWDKKGNASGTSQMEVNVNGMDVNTLQSVTTVSPAKIPADGISQATVSVTLQTKSGESAVGLASRMSIALSAPSGNTSTSDSQSTAKQPDVTRFNETSPGVYTATLTSGTQPGTFTLQPLLDGTVKLASARLIVEATQSIAQLEELKASNTSALADGTTPLTLTAHVTDQYGKPVKDEAIDWTADNAQAHLSASQTTTDANGDAQIQVTSTQLIATVVTAKLKNGAVQNSPALHFTADINTANVVSLSSEKQQVVANNNDTSTVTARVMDTYNHPLSGVKVNWSVNKTDNTQVAEKTSVSDDNGEATLSLKSSKTGTVTVTADINGKTPQVTDPIHFVADSSSQKVSLLTLSKTDAVANGTDNITYEATVTDASGNPIADVPVNWSASNSNVRLSSTQTASDSSGKAQINVTSLKSGRVVISAQIDGSAVFNAEEAAFIADSATAKVTQVLSDRSSAVANGSDALTLSATVTDANDNPLSDVNVNWAAAPASGKLSAQSSKTGNDGVANVQLTTDVAADYSVIASANNSSQSVNNLHFTSDSATAQLASLSADKTTEIVADNDVVTLVATVVDAGQNPVPGATVNWSSSEPRSSFSTGSSVTDAQGKATTTFSSLSAGDIVVTATTGNSSQTQKLQVTGNVATAKVITLEADKSQAVADGSSSVTWRAVVKDANNNPLENRDINWSSNNSNVVLSAPQSTTDSNGETSVTGSSLISGSVQVTASLGSSTESLTASEVKFIADVNSGKVTSLTPDTTVAIVNTTRVTYTAEVKDANDNPLENATVSWQSSLNSLSAQTSTTNAEGKATIQLSGPDTGNAQVTASFNNTDLKDSRVGFIASYTADWHITSDKSTYETPAIFGFPSLGFIAIGGTTGPDSLVWTETGVSELTTQMQDENGQTWSVKFGGQRESQCSLHTFNSAITCSSWASGYSADLSFDRSDNPGLPAGTYHGVIEFAGKDWHTSWALNYSVATVITVQ